MGLTREQYRSSAIRALHQWVAYHLGKPSKCVDCGTTAKRKYEWANISQEYKRDLSDWKRLCVPCHSKFDAKPYCRNRHFRTKENTVFYNNKKVCKECSKDNRKKNHVNHRKATDKWRELHIERWRELNRLAAKRRRAKLTPEERKVINEKHKIYWQANKERLKQQWLEATKQRYEQTI